MFWRRMACVAVLVAGPAAQAEPIRYVLNQDHATIGFATSGLFGTHGYFRKFSGTLALDFAAPEQSAVRLTLDDRDITVALPLGAALLRSPAYFDSARYPQITFRSLGASKDGRPGHFAIEGALTIRGITRPQTMEAILTRAAPGIAELNVTGTLHRSAFGMVANRATVDDAVVLDIHARLAVPD